MTNLGRFHDGFLEGLWSPGDHSAHVFLRTLAGERFTAVLEGVIMLAAGGFQEANIVFDANVRHGEDVTPGDIKALYDLEPDAGPAEWEMALLRRVRQEGLELLEITSSYGASLLALCSRCRLVPRAEWLRGYSRLE